MSGTSAGFHVCHHTHTSFGLSVYNCATRNSKHTSLSRGCWVYIMANVLQQAWVHLEEPAPWRNVNVSTFPARCFCLTPSVLLGLQREVTKLSLKFKQRCWPSAKSATLSRGRIWGYWVDPCCVSLLRENDLLHCRPSAVDQGQECGRNIQTLSLCCLKRANGLWWEKQKNH